MTERAITPLRQRMIEDMAIRRLSPRTQLQYMGAVARFARHFGRSPDTLGYEDVRAYQLHLVQSGLAIGSVNGAVTALRFFYKVTMGRSDAPDMIPLARRPEKQRAVLTPQEVARLIDAAPGAKYRAALSVAYGAGLRASEVIALKVSDVDMITIIDGKGQKDRYAKLSSNLLGELRAWWRAARPRVWMFPSRMSAFDHISPRRFARAPERGRGGGAWKVGPSAHAAPLVQYSKPRTARRSKRQNFRDALDHPEGAGDPHCVANGQFQRRSYCWAATPHPKHRGQYGRKDCQLPALYADVE